VQFLDYQYQPPHPPHRPKLVLVLHPRQDPESDQSDEDRSELEREA
jgi:hypothetical protein